MDEITNQEALRAKAEAEVRSQFPFFLSQTETLRKDVRLWIKWSVVFFSSPLLSFFVVYVFREQSGSTETLTLAGFGIAFLFFLPLVALGAYSAYRVSKGYRQFNQKVKELLVPVISRVLKIPVTYVVGTAEERRLSAIVKENNLIPECFSKLEVEDVYKIAAGGETTVAEIQATVESDKSTRTVFMGIIAEIKLAKVLHGKTLLVPEQDKGNFSHQSIINQLFRQADLKETILEWNDFENLIHVATTDEVEARYILTPSFMVDVYEWWQEQKVSIRIFFVKDTLYILLPYEGVRFGYTTLSHKEQDIINFVYSIADPIWRVRKLAQDVRL